MHIWKMRRAYGRMMKHIEHADQDRHPSAAKALQAVGRELINNAGAFNRIEVRITAGGLVTYRGSIKGVEESVEGVIELGD
jgi:hypothetical protein